MYGILRKVCPLCGGTIIVSDLYQLSYDYVITRTGKKGKKRKVSGPGSMEVSIAACENAPDACNATWNPDEFVIDENDRFVDLKYVEKEE